MNRPPNAVTVSQRFFKYEPWRAVDGVLLCTVQPNLLHHRLYLGWRLNVGSASDEYNAWMEFALTLQGDVAARFPLETGVQLTRCFPPPSLPMFWSIGSVGDTGADDACQLQYQTEGGSTLYTKQVQPFRFTAEADKFTLSIRGAEVFAGTGPTSLELYGMLLSSTHAL